MVDVQAFSSVNSGRGRPNVVLGDASPGQSIIFHGGYRDVVDSMVMLPSSTRSQYDLRGGDYK